LLEYDVTNKILLKIETNSKIYTFVLLCSFAFYGLWKRGSNRHMLWTKCYYSYHQRPLRTSRKRHLCK